MFNTSEDVACIVKLYCAAVINGFHVEEKQNFGHVKL